MVRKVLIVIAITSACFALLLQCQPKTRVVTGVCGESTCICDSSLPLPNENSLCTQYCNNIDSITHDRVKHNANIALLSLLIGSELADKNNRKRVYASALPYFEHMLIVAECNKLPEVGKVFQLYNSYGHWNSELALVIQTP